MIAHIWRGVVQVDDADANYVRDTGFTLPGDRGVPRDAWTWPTGTADAIPYHPANQFWPLQFTFLTILLALTVAVLVLGWHATRTRAV